ncbi:acyl carrier protein [Streptomyces sp. S.PNR 29]|uniref:acyl carrier protein n=1 Tax=Streptomyces sp. S.PNR 29 TaxID=2973805 RepID=UPI0025AF1F6A|nr:acyl carrier protein [Streptomyces sp. S.PNR 29]MDN0201112.1 acyl carrier protein [Streptomyces sp. S.PNR 29]
MQDIADITKIEDTVKQVLAEVLGNGTTVEMIRSDGNMVEEYGLDSLQAISFLLSIEDAFGIQLDFESLSLDLLRSVREFGEYVSSQLAGAE